MKFWLFLLPSLAFAEWPASSNMRKGPIYVDVEAQKAVIYPEKMGIAAAALAAPRNEFENFLDHAERVRSVRHLVLRPAGAPLSPP